MSKLEHPGARRAVIDEVERGGSLNDAARAIGYKSRQAITRYRDLDTPESRAFKLELHTAQLRRDQMADQTRPPWTPPDEPSKPSKLEKARIEPAKPNALALAEPAPYLWTRDEYLERLQEVATDDEHPANATAWRLLGGWYLEAPIAAKRIQAEREAADTGDGGTVKRFNMELPAPDSGPGEDIEPDVIDAEVIE